MLYKTEPTVSESSVGLLSISTFPASRRVTLSSGALSVSHSSTFFPRMSDSISEKIKMHYAFEILIWRE